jgi:hypothetical protein
MWGRKKIFKIFFKFKNTKFYESCNLTTRFDDSGVTLPCLPPACIKGEMGVEGW